MKKWVLISFIVIAAGAGAYYYSGDTAEDSGIEDIKTDKITKGDLRVEVLARGTVTPDIEVIVKSKAGGEITSFPFNEGDRLKKGQTAVKLDPKTEKSRANQAEANLMMSEAKLDKAKTSMKDAGVKLKRQKKLFEDGIISRQELDDAEIAFEKSKSDVKIAEAEVFQMKEALSEANDRLADTQIKAPIEGTILKKFVEEGQVIASTLSSVSEGTQILSMANLDNIYVKALVDEIDISRINVDQEVLAMIESLPERVFKGRVERIAPQGKIERTVTVFEVVVEITDEDKAILRPGMTADAKILTDIRKDVLLVPNGALKVKDGGETGVYVFNGGKPDWVPVKTGKTDDVLTEVVEGVLKPGQEVVISGLSKGQQKPPKKTNLLYR